MASSLYRPKACLCSSVKLLGDAISLIRFSDCVAGSRSPRLNELEGLRR